MKIYGESDRIILECTGCGERRAVPACGARRTFMTHLNRFDRQHHHHEIRARLDKDYETAGRTAARILRKFTKPGVQR